MEGINFEEGAVQVGQNAIFFKKKQFQGKYAIWIPREFIEDKGLVSNYNYLYNQDDSPLSIAIRYTPVSSSEDRKKMVRHHFSRGSGDSAPPEALGDAVYYRDTLAKGRDMSVYSLRFSVEVDDGILFGCFNCAGPDMTDWKPVVLSMLQSVTPVVNS